MENFEMNDNDKLKIAPTDEIINRLKEAAKNGDNRTYNRLIDQVDWNLASDSVIDQAIDIALAFMDTHRAKHLAEIGHKRFPEHKTLARTWRMFNPPPARVAKSRWRSSPEELQASMDWLREHAREYNPGHWLAVKSGRLIADAPTRKELKKIIDNLGEPEILATNSIVYQVMA
jgi:hypothetical protein